MHTTDTYTSLYLRSVRRQAVRQTLHREKVARKWQMPGYNPLSIYTIDPTRLAVLSFNGGMQERRKELQGLVDDIRTRVELIKPHNLNTTAI